MGAQNFNSALTFPQNGEFLDQNLFFWGRKFSDKKKILQGCQKNILKT